MKVVKFPLVVTLSILAPMAGLLCACSSLNSESSGPKAPICYAYHDVKKGATIMADDIIEHKVDPQKVPGDAAAKSDLIGQRASEPIEAAQVFSLRDIGKELTPSQLSKLNYLSATPADKQTGTVVVAEKNIAKGSPLLETDCKNAQMDSNAIPMDALSDSKLVRDHVSKVEIKKGEIIMQHEMLNPQH